MKKVIVLLSCFILISSVSIFAQLTFGPQQIITRSDASGPQSVFSIDIDGDGDKDVLSASNYDNKIAWYENMDGIGTFSDQQLISIHAEGASSVFGADIDGDGDIDVISASRVDDKIAWYNNTDGLGTFISEPIITTNADGASSVFAVDIDNDGDIDVLSASGNDNKIAWYENTNGLGTFGIQQVITTNANGASSVYCTDIDGDGDQDVLSSSLNDSKIAWYENINGNGSFSNEQIISLNVSGAISIISDDIDNDGDQDVITASSWDDKVLWFENTNGLGTFGIQQVITVNANSVFSVFSSDIDGDGNLDVLSASRNDDKIAWYRNIDGNGTFSPEQIVSMESNEPHSVFVSDIDGDGDQDVLSASFRDDKIAWYENTDGTGTFGPQQILTSSPTSGANSIYATDIDGDGYKDILSASFDDYKIAWYRNIDGNGTLSSQNIITINAQGASSVFAVDIDNDGDQDVLSASRNDDKIAWYENYDGLGSFGEQQIISTNANYAESVYGADLDGDGDSDVISASKYDDKIAWYKNLDGNGTFSSEQLITTNADGAYDIFVIDLDGDGDNDVLSASESDDKIAWYENMDGNGLFGSQQVITTEADSALSVFAIDLDGDGDHDVLSGSAYDDKIAWYENIDGNGTFGSQQIISTEADYPNSVFATDLDNDGDYDVLSSSSHDDKIAWYENNGNGSFNTQQIITNQADGAIFVLAVDINNDGRKDVFSASLFDDKIAWYENLGSLNVTEETSLSFEIYPNPSDGILRIKSQKNILQINVYDSLGKSVLRNSNKHSIDISSIKQGLFYIKIIDANGIIGIKKFIKKS